MKNQMIIVGAGIAGLSTGCYAQMNGYRSRIFEMHTIPGGLCTAWKRKGFTFDISMHMLMGSKSGAIHQMWRELGMIQDRRFHYHTEMTRIEGKRKTLSICTDPDKLLAQLTSLSPADEKRSREFVRLISGRSMMGGMSLKPAELHGMVDKLKMLFSILPLMGRFRRYGKQTIQEFAQGFKDPFLRQAIRFIIDSPGWPMHRYPMVALCGFIRMAVEESGVPLGGSQQAVFKIAENYRHLGGEILYKQRVADIIVENDRAVGIRLEDGSIHRADTIVWAGDGHSVIFDILGGKYMNDAVKQMYTEWMPTQSLVMVMLGVARDLSKESHQIIYELDDPIRIADIDHSWLSMRHHCFDPGMAPEGKSVVEVWYPTRYEFWEKLAPDKEAYESEKRRIAEVTIAELDRRQPGLASQVEVVDVATPATYVRYTGNWKGSPDGWYITPENMMNQDSLRQLPGLANFYMVGQWTAPFTGTVMAALSGRQLIQLLCKMDGKMLITSGLA